MKIDNREKYILDKCKNKNVLDIGAVDHKAITENKSYWLHKNIKKVAYKLTGLDNNKKEIEILNKKGYNIILGNAEQFNLNEKFDTIICGEIIEHLSNQGLFFKSIKNHLKDNGILIITTPNVFRLRNLLRMVFIGIVIPNSDHTCWYDEITLNQLVNKNNMRVVSKHYYFNSNTNNFKYYIEYLLTIFNDRFKPQILFIIKK